uniref:Endonuclease NucS n=1 Tax=Ignisphaera aggregans TaxID=334771 RepID=A0A7J3MXQ6_9CREN
MCSAMKICSDIDQSSCTIIAKILNMYKKEWVIVIVGQTSIEYIGRASSYAYPANRMIIAKPDGSLLVHESTRVDPLNWQPPKSSSYFECVGDKLRLRSTRDKPYEEVFIEFIEIDFIKICKLSTTKLSIVGRESDLIKLIVSNPQVLTLAEEVSIVGIDIPTPYGKIDILIKKDNTMIVVEVKNEKAGVPAVAQLKRYVEYYLSQNHKVEGILIAPEITQEALALMNREGFRFIALHELVGKSRPNPTLEKFININKT